MHGNITEANEKRSESATDTEEGRTTTTASSTTTTTTTSPSAMTFEERVQHVRNRSIEQSIALYRALKKYLFEFVAFLAKTAEPGESEVEVLVTEIERRISLILGGLTSPSYVHYLLFCCCCCFCCC
jgi:hypothetical protein